MNQKHDKTITTETTYQYDGYDNVTSKKTVQTVSEPAPLVSDGYPLPTESGEAETGIEIEGVLDVSPLKAFLAAIGGAFIGNLIYYAIHGD